MDLTQKCGGKGAKAVGMMGSGAKSLWEMVKVWLLRLAGTLAPLCCGKPQPSSWMKPEACGRRLGRAGSREATSLDVGWAAHRPPDSIPDSHHYGLGDGCFQCSTGLDQDSQGQRKNNCQTTKQGQVQGGENEREWEREERPPTQHKVLETIREM